MSAYMSKASSGEITVVKECSKDLSKVLSSPDRNQRAFGHVGSGGSQQSAAASDRSSARATRPFGETLSDHAVHHEEVYIRQSLATNMADFASICDHRGHVCVNIEDLEIHSTSERDRRRTIKSWVMEPASSLRLTIDVCSMVILFFDLCLTPFLFAWEMTPSGPLAYGSYVTAVYWSIDMLANFRTGFYHEGTLEMNSCKVAQHYLRTNFLLDGGVLLTEYFGMFTSSVENQNTGAELLRLTKVGRILRLVGVLRVSHLADIFNRLNMRHASLGFALHISAILMVMVYVTHAFACLWYWVGAHASSDTGARWVDLTGAVHGQSYKDLSIANQYFTAFHFVLTQVASGSMEVNPVNTNERVLTNFLVLFGLLTFGSLVSSLSTLMVDVRASAQKRVKQKTLMRRYLRNLGVRQQLAFNLEAYVHLRLDYQPPLTYDDVDALNLLSAQLRNDLQVEVYGPHLQVNPIVRICCHIDKGLLRNLVRDVVDSKFYDDSTIIFADGRESVAAYMVMEGKAQYTLDGGNFDNPDELAEDLTAGTCYAEATLWSYWTHRGTATPKMGGCVMLTIDAEGFAGAAQQRRFVRDLVWEYAVSFCRCLRQYNANATDVQVSHTSYDDVMLFLHEPVRVFLGIAACAMLEESVNKGNWSGGFLPAIDTVLPTGMGESPPAIADLVKEVNDSRSLVVVTPSGEVQRLVVLACVRIERNDKRIFVHLGKVSDEDYNIKASCALPGMKMKDGEQVASIYAKLVNDAELQSFAGLLYPEMETKDVEWQYSRRYGVFTKYIRYVKHCSICDENLSDHLPLTVAIPSMKDRVGSMRSSDRSRPAAGWMNRSGSSGRSSGDIKTRSAKTSAITDVVLTLGHPKGPYVSGWVLPQDFEVLRKPSNEASLQRWLDTLPIQAVLSETSADWGLANFAGNASYV